MEHHIQHIQHFIQNEIKDQDQDVDSYALLIIGASKSGKTRTCQDALRNIPINSLLVLEYENIDSHADLLKQTSNFISTPMMFETTRPKNMCPIIFFDDIDILFAQDRYANSHVQDLIKSKQVKLIMTCAASEERKTTEIKKKVSNVIRLNKAIQSQDPLMAYFDKNIYQVVEHIFADGCGSIKDTELGTSLDPTLISFMMFDNYKAHFCNVYKLPHPASEQAHKLVNPIAIAYMHTSILEDFVFSTNDWALAEMSSLIRCHTIRATQRDLLLAASTSTSTTLVQPPPTIAYTQITSRSAQHYNVLKKTMGIPEINVDNIPLLAQIPFIKSNLKNDIGMVCHAFAFNIIKARPKRTLRC